MGVNEINVLYRLDHISSEQANFVLTSYLLFSLSCYCIFSVKGLWFVA